MVYDIKMYISHSNKRWILWYFLLLFLSCGQVICTEKSQDSTTQPEDVLLPGNQPPSEHTLVSSDTTRDPDVSIATESIIVLAPTDGPGPVITDTPPASSTTSAIEPSHTSQTASSTRDSKIDEPVLTEQTASIVEDQKDKNLEPVQELYHWETLDDQYIDSSDDDEIEVEDHPSSRESQQGDTISARPEQPDGKHETSHPTQLKLSDLAGHGGMAVDVDRVREDKTEEEGLTFNEWTQKVLAEAEKDKKDDSEGSTKLASTKKQKKNKNYALIECGAKILAHNPEAKDAKTMLNFNRDEYMINPCKAKKWFVVELCEPIQAHSVEIASLELFSSPPKFFKVYLSDRYPTKDWRLAGEFNTTEERVVQTFLITQLQGYFAKYARVELLDHYGEEHFCPVTLFRLYGKGVDEDDDMHHVGHEDEEEDDEDEDEEEATEDAKTDTKTLFRSAKDIVFNVVKKVLNVEDQAENNNGTDVVSLSDGQANGTDNTVKSADQLPCPPDASIDSPTIEPNPQDTVTGTFPVTPAPGSSDATTAIVTKLDDDEQLETNVHIGAHLPDGSIPSWPHSPVEICLQHNPSHDLSLTDKTWYPSAMCRFIFIALTKCSLYKSVIDIEKPVENLPVFVALGDLKDEGGHSSQTVQIVRPSQTDSAIRTSTISPSQADTSIKDKLDASRSSDFHTSQANHETASHVTSGVVTHHATSGHVTDHVTCDDRIGKVSETSQSVVTIPVSSTRSLQLDGSTTQASSSFSASSIFSSASSPEIKATVSATSSFSSSSIVSSTTHVSGSFQDRTPSVEPTSSQTASAFVDTAIHSPSSETTHPILEPSEMKSPDDVIIIYPSQSSTEWGEQVVHTGTPALPSAWKPNTDDFMETLVSSTSDQDLSSASSVEKPIVTTSQADGPSVTSSDSASLTETSGGERSKHGQVTGPQQQQQHQQQQQQQVFLDEKNIIDASDDKPPTEERSVDSEKLVSPGKGHLDLVHVPVIPSKRESAIMRLSNRMKVLEQNVSLSSRFLEELSRRYKKQSEDMMKLLNKTMARLNNMTVESQVSNKLHEDEMGQMERRLENLTAIVTRLTVNLEQINKQVTDRQMIWMSIEIIIIIIMLLVTRGRRPSKPEIPYEIRQLIESMPSKPVTGASYRRNSLSGPATPSKSAENISGGLQKYSSEISLAQPTCVSPYTKPIFAEANNKPPKKKKKKQKSLDLKTLFGSEISNVLPKKKDLILSWQQDDCQPMGGLPCTSSSDSVTSWSSDSRGITSRKSGAHSGHGPPRKARAASLTEIGQINVQATGGVGIIGGASVGVGGTNVGVGRTNVGISGTSVGVGGTNVGVGRINAGVGRTNVGIGGTSVGISGTSAGMGGVNVRIGGASVGMVGGAENRTKGHRRNKSLPKVSDLRPVTEIVSVGDKMLSVKALRNDDEQIVLKKSLGKPSPSFQSSSVSEGKECERTAAKGIEWRVNGCDEIKSTTLGTKPKRQAAVNGKHYIQKHSKEDVLRLSQDGSPTCQPNGEQASYCTSTLNNSLGCYSGAKSSSVLNGFGKNHSDICDSGHDADSVLSSAPSWNCGPTFESELGHSYEISTDLKGKKEESDMCTDSKSLQSPVNFENITGKKGFWFFNH